MTGPNDSWQSDARKRLLRYVLTAAMRGIDYSPDTSYERLKLGQSGPHTIALADILERWAAMWAADMREAQAAGIELDANAEWKRCMVESDAEVLRYLANNRLTRAA